MIRALKDDWAPDLGESGEFVRDNIVEANDSVDQVLGTPDSILLPSEPPDIKNWFSSYVYESLVLETNDNFGFSDHQETEADKEESNTRNMKKDSKGIYGSEENDDLLGEKITSRFIKCDQSGEDDVTEHKCLNHVLDSQVLPLLSSEPPDIRNWFSSYEYGSPVLGSGEHFQFSDLNESTVDKDCDTTKVSKAEDLREIVRTNREDHVVIGRTEPSNFVKYKRSLENHEYEPRSVNRMNNTVGRGECSFIPDDSPERIINHLLVGQRLEEGHGGSTKDSDNSILNGKSSTKNPTNEIPSIRRSMDIIVSSVDNAQVSPSKLIRRKDSIKPCSERKAQTEDGVEADGHSWKTTKINSIKKDENGFEANDFVSTKRRVHRRENGENSTSSCSGGSQLQHLTNQATDSSVGHVKDGIMRRKALTDSTNIQQSNVLEVTGKWKCPRKDKPNFRPPLKQLRLERWVHRE